MQSNHQEITITILPIDVVCYLALNYLDYSSAVNFFKELIIKHFTIQNALTPNEELFDELKRFRSSPPYNQCEEVSKKLSLSKAKIVAGDEISFYFSPREGWFVWGEDAEIFTGMKSNLPQKLNLSLTNNTSQLWQNLKLDIVDIVNSRQRTFFLTNDGKIYRKGKDFPGDASMIKRNISRNGNLTPMLEFVKGLDNKKIIKLALGDNHILALTDSGQVYSWGVNDFGQLGLRSGYQSVPKLITAFDKIKITNIFAGMKASFCISEEGKVYAFGLNAEYELGLKDHSRIFEPQLITTLQHKKIISIACKKRTTLFLSEAGEVFSVGASIRGSLGLGKITATQTPTQIDSLTNIKMIANGGEHSLCLDEKGTVYSFGCNIGEDLSSTPKPVSFPEDERIIAVAAGAYHNLYLTKKGELYSFGQNEYEQQDHSITTQPNKVTLPFNSTINHPLELIDTPKR